MKILFICVTFYQGRLVIGGSRDMPNKLWFSIYAAAAIIQMLRQQRDAVGLTLFDNNIRFHSRAKSSPVHIKQLFAEMEKMLDTDGYFNDAYRRMVKYFWHRIQAGAVMEDICKEYDVLRVKYSTEKQQ